MSAEVIDVETTEIAVKNEDSIVEIEEERGMTLTEKIISMIPEAGNVELPDEKLEALFAPVDESQVEIRPDGLIYLPWVYYAIRLNQAFGVGWVMIPDGKPKIEDTLILWPFYLVVRGKLMGYAIGEQDYQPTNRTMSYGDAIEGAKSNALMRICKSLGIGLELWQPTFINAWKAKYASSEWRTVKGKNKQVWFRKGGDKHSETAKHTEPDNPQSEESAPQSKGHVEDTSILLRHIHGFAGDMAIEHGRLHKWCAQQWNDFTSLGDLDTAHLLKLKQSLEKLADRDIQPEHVGLIVELAQEAGFESIDDDKFKAYVKKDVGFEYEIIDAINGFKGIAIVKNLREAIKALQEAEAAQADKAQAVPQDDNVTMPGEDISMEGPDDFFPQKGKVSNNPEHLTPEQMERT